MWDTENRSANAKLRALVSYFYTGFLGFSVNDVPYMSWNTQQQFLNMTTNSERLKKYPVNKKFTRLFFKKLLQNIEETQDIHDDFYTSLCTAMNESTPDMAYCHYVIDDDLNNIITIRETNNMVVSGTTGLKTWEAALMLTDWALCNKALLENRNILELGSGLGLTGITVAKLCEIQSIYLTDHHDQVLNMLKENIRINFPDYCEKEDNGSTLYQDHTKTLGVLLLDWNNISNIPSELRPDVILGADIIYDPDILQPLCNVFRTFFDRNSSLEIYIESVKRNEVTFQMFTELLDSMNFKYEHLHQDNSVHIEWSRDVERCLLKITC